MDLELVTLDQWNEALAAGRAKYAATGFLPDVFKWRWAPLGQCFGPLPSEYPPTAEEIEEALPAHDPTDRVQRALVASIIASMIDTTEIEANSSDSIMLCTLLRNYLAASYSDPETLPDLRWEIRAGLAARDVRRVSSHCNLWLGFDPAAELLDIAIGSAFAALCRLETGRAWIDAAWEESPLPESPPSGQAPSDPTRLLMFEWAKRVHPADPLYPPPLDQSDLRDKMFAHYFYAQDVVSETSGPSEQDRQDRIALVGVCASLVQRLGPERLSRSQYLVALSAWCDVAIGAQQDRPDLIAQGAMKYMQIPGAGWTAVDCYQHAGMLAEAEREARKCIAVSPTSTAYRRLSEILDKQERTAEAVEAFETYVRLKDDQRDSWLDSFALRLGLESQQRQRVLLQSAAADASWAPMGQQLIGWIHPWFSQLCPDAKRRWWTGLYVLSAPEFCANLGEASVWEIAADAFGEAVAVELKHSVFQAFREAHPGEPSTQPLPDHWKRVNDGNATLGNLMHCLINAKYPPLPVGRSFSAWLQQHKQPLFDYICRRNVDLLRLATLRGAAQHGTVTQAEARQVFEDAASLLQRIVSA